MSQLYQSTLLIILGLFIFPTNLIILIVVSVLVGFNIMFSAFALRLRSAIATTAVLSNNRKSIIATTKLGSKRYTFLNSIAYAAGFIYRMSNLCIILHLWYDFSICNYYIWFIHSFNCLFYIHLLFANFCI